ncbi:MAG: peptidase S41, partial [Muribaculum sp.]|nr:peptidase S41 [Muribaculum sp.]
FKTVHGREVRDGGGITPDIDIDYGEANRLTYNIVSDHWAFDYATRYAAMNPEIAPAEEWQITDSIFDDFKQYIDPEKFNYDKVCEQMLASLKKAAEIEGYMNDSTSKEFSVLEGLLKHDLSHDLDNNRKDIEEILASEIIRRYYYQKGQVIEALKRDPTLDSAVVVLNDKVRYKDLLSPAAK